MAKFQKSYCHKTGLFFLLFSFITVACAQQESLNNYLQTKATSFESTDDLHSFFDACKHKKLVLLGEASHGTHEYYIWRDSISRNLIQNQNFNFIAVEGDFASIYELNKFVKHKPGAAQSAQEAIQSLNRWPEWMWKNHETLALIEWLHEYNSTKEKEKRVGFYGMDVYDEWNSVEKLLTSLQEKKPDLYQTISQKLGCLMPFKDDSWEYARAVASTQTNCSGNLEEIVSIIISHKEELSGISEEYYFYILQNARVIKNAEKFYRKSVTTRDASSWNARVNHMHTSIKKILEKYGEDSKGIVWAHNTHIGDSYYTGMRFSGEENIGNLSRKALGRSNVLLVGFTTNTGTVKAGRSWGSNMQKMTIPPAGPESLEYIVSSLDIPQLYMLFTKDDRTHEEFSQAIGNRAIGVVYNPINDARQFVPTIVPQRYDVLFFFETTRALSSISN